MRSRKPFIIFWSQYFDAKRTRAQGRRVPKKYAVEKVSASEIDKIANKLGYQTQYEASYKYPRTWWDDGGRVLVDTKGKIKSKVLIELAKELKKIHPR
jgi:signal recognition particle subunit SRP19